MTKLEKNVPYSRAEIQKFLGGEFRTYLPQKNREVLSIGV